MTWEEHTSGMPRELLKYLDKNTELAITAIDSHKSDFKHNILYILVGFILSLIPLGVNSITEQKEKELLIKQFDVINASYDNLQKELYRMRLKNDSLKIELLNLKLKN